MDETQVGPEKTLLLAAPHGLEEIVATFGDIYDYIRPGGQLDPRWQADHLASVELPFSLPPAWDPSKSINRMTCHKRMAENLSRYSVWCRQEGYNRRLRHSAGALPFASSGLGLGCPLTVGALRFDLNSGTNAQGSSGDMDAGVIEIFRSAGFEWGGDWSGKRRDAMHFQFCSGY